jgi:hypothetical protein
MRQSVIRVIIWAGRKALGVPTWVRTKPPLNCGGSARTRGWERQITSLSRVLEGWAGMVVRRGHTCESMKPVG